MTAPMEQPFDPFVEPLQAGDEVASLQGLRGVATHTADGRLKLLFEDGSEWEGDVANRCLFRLLRKGEKASPPDAFAMPLGAGYLDEIVHGVHKGQIAVVGEAWGADTLLRLPSNGWFACDKARR